MGMEFDRVLDPDNENDIFCLHEVCKPTINNMLNRFTDSWQNHKLQTTRNKSVYNGHAANWRERL